MCVRGCVCVCVANLRNNVNIISNSIFFFVVERLPRPFNWKGHLTIIPECGLLEWFLSKRWTHFAHPLSLRCCYSCAIAHWQILSWRTGGANWIQRKFFVVYILKDFLSVRISGALVIVVVDASALMHRVAAILSIYLGSVFILRNTERRKLYRPVIWKKWKERKGKERKKRIQTRQDKIRCDEVKRRTLNRVIEWTDIWTTTSILAKLNIIQ